MTEGITEYIAFSVGNREAQLASSYYIEAAIVSQLMIIIGQKKMFEAYFSNKSIEVLEQELLNLIPDKILAVSTFRRIEDNYQLRQVGIGNTIISHLQLALVRYLEAKILRDGPLTEQELMAYESSMLTTEQLKHHDLDMDMYFELNKSFEEFSKLKDKQAKTVKI